MSGGVTSKLSSEPSSTVSIRTLILITIVVGGPYAAYLSYYYLHLQSGLMREPVALTSPRQLLVVGTQSSGTTDMTAKLKALGLEVEHESSDTAWTFARDGTVSWLHALRFMPGSVASTQLLELCSKSRRNMGFHPAMFRVPHRGCSYRSEWDRCWSAECVELVQAEWGCASRSSCETPFARSLLQVRHPLRVAESLAVKFCPSLQLPPHAHLRSFLHVLFPEHDWAARGCAVTMVWYWVLYNEAMLAAHAAGTIDGWYRIEAAHACQVARDAGFLNESSAIYKQSSERAVAACSAGTSPGTPSHRRKNQRNQGQVTITLADIEAWPSSSDAEQNTLKERLLALMSQLGYDTSK